MLELAAENVAGVLGNPRVGPAGDQTFGGYRGRQRLPQLVREQAQHAIAFLGRAHDFLRRGVPDVGVHLTSSLARIPRVGLEQHSHDARRLGCRQRALLRARDELARGLEVGAQPGHRPFQLTGPAARHLPPTLQQSPATGSLF